MQGVWLVPNHEKPLRRFARVRVLWLHHNPTHFKGFSTLLSAPDTLTERSNILAPKRCSDDSISSAVGNAWQGPPDINPDTT